MRLSRLALAAILSALAATVPATVFAEGANVPRTGMAAVSQPIDAASRKVQVAAAKLAWKQAQTQEKQPAGLNKAASEPFNLRVRNGKLVVDGVIAKENLYYSLEKATSLSFYLPGTGTLVMTPDATPGSTAVKAAIHDNMLSFAVAGHTVAIASESAMTDKNSVDAYVHLDKNSANLGNYAQMGYSVMNQSMSDWTPSAEPARVTMAQK